MQMGGQDPGPPGPSAGSKGYLGPKAMQASVTQSHSGIHLTVTMTAIATLTSQMGVPCQAQGKPHRPHWLSEWGPLLTSFHEEKQSLRGPGHTAAEL
jgi:hypothetical protein